MIKSGGTGRVTTKHGSPTVKRPDCLGDGGDPGDKPPIEDDCYHEQSNASNINWGHNTSDGFGLVWVWLKSSVKDKVPQHLCLSLGEDALGKAHLQIFLSKPLKTGSRLIRCYSMVGKNTVMSLINITSLYGFKPLNMVSITY